MSKVLVVKTSSMGDVIHCLPAVTDLLKHDPSLHIDWVVEEALRDIPSLHPGVQHVIPVAIRRWRNSWRQSWGEIQSFKQQLQKESYDLIVDAQGLIKSAIVASFANGPVAGFDRASVKESFATFMYGRKAGVARELHAIQRQRLLFSSLFNYQFDSNIDYGLAETPSASNSGIMFFHGTTWHSKHWPDNYWLELARLVSEQGQQILVPYTNETEKLRAEKLKREVSAVEILAPGSLGALADRIKDCRAVVSVDTGPGHLAAALDKPLVAVYGPTSATLTGIVGEKQISLASSSLPCAPCLKRDCQYQSDSISIHPPCFESLTPIRVLESLNQQIANAAS